MISAFRLFQPHTNWGPFVIIIILLLVISVYVAEYSLPTVNLTKFDYHPISEPRFPFKYRAKPEIVFKATTPIPAISYIRSAPNEFERRDKIRSLWATNLTRIYNMPMVFLLGITNNEHMNDRLYNESVLTKDLLITDLVDDYLNLTLKMSTAFHFHAFYLAEHLQPKHVFWGNTDTLINVKNFVKFIRGAPAHNFLAGHIVKDGLVVSQKYRKWYIPKRLYSNTYYPPYLGGFGVFLSNDVFLKLADVSENTDPKFLEAFAVDDTLLTGIWRELLHIPLSSCKPLCCDYTCTGTGRDVCQRWNQSILLHIDPDNIDPTANRQVLNCK